MNTLEASLHSLRLLIDAEIGKKSSVLVASADEGDGAAVIASGLASVYANAGSRVALVGNRSAIDVQVAGIAYLSYDQFLQGASDSTSFTFGSFDTIVVEAGSLFSNSKAIDAAAYTQGVVCSIRTGRSVLEADTDLSAFLQRLGLHRLGVVMMPSKLPKASIARAAEATPVAVRSADSAFSRA